MLYLVRIERIGRRRALAIVSACDALLVNLESSPAARNLTEGALMGCHDKRVLRKGQRVNPGNVCSFLKDFHQLYGNE